MEYKGHYKIMGVERSASPDFSDFFETPFSRGFAKRQGRGTDAPSDGRTRRQDFSTKGDKTVYTDRARQFTSFKPRGSWNQAR